MFEVKTPSASDPNMPKSYIIPHARIYCQHKLTKYPVGTYAVSSLFKRSGSIHRAETVIDGRVQRTAICGSLVGGRLDKPEGTIHVGRIDPHTPPHGVGLCPVCAGSTCLYCGAPDFGIEDHDCDTAADTLTAQDELPKNAIKGRDYQICPNQRCRARFLRRDGSNEMTCPKCWEYFCFLCGLATFPGEGHFDAGWSAGPFCPRDEDDRPEREQDSPGGRLRATLRRLNRVVRDSKALDPESEPMIAQDFSLAELAADRKALGMACMAVEEIMQVHPCAAPELAELRDYLYELYSFVEAIRVVVVTRSCLVLLEVETNAQHVFDMSLPVLWEEFVANTQRLPDLERVKERVTGCLVERVMMLRTLVFGGC